MKIKNVLNLKSSYEGASGIKVLNMYTTKELPKKKELPKVKKGVYGVDGGQADGGE